MSRVIDVRCDELRWTHGDECKACSCVDGYLARYILANGSVSIRWICSWCEGYTTGGDIPHAFLKQYGATLDELPLRQDNTLDTRAECAVCGSPAVEFHHWAPRALFDGDWWTVGEYLCRSHHTQWHDVMRAHGLRYPHELEAA